MPERPATRTKATPTAPGASVPEIADARVHPIVRPARATTRRQRSGGEGGAELVELARQAEASGLDVGVLVESWGSPRVLDGVRRRVEAQGVCTDRHVDLAPFFPTEGSESAKGQQEVDAARLCAGCPVARLCLTWAVATGQDFGVWGGRAQHQVRGLGRRFASLLPKASKAGSVPVRRSA